MESNVDYSIVSKAGRMEGRNRTVSSVLETRLDVLTKHQERLLRLGLLSNLDEVASARHAYQKLMGPSGVNFFKTEELSKEGKCWKHLISGKEQGQLNVKSLREGLKLAKERRCWYQNEAKLGIIMFS